ncbi:hypothetical protein AS29_005530 [Bacillus sp. SJS]|nr:hypothetical protein AS29_005530 [Bacillus sp. SJS]
MLSYANVGWLVPGVFADCLSGAGLPGAEYAAYLMGVPPRSGVPPVAPTNIGLLGRRCGVCAAVGERA